MLCDTLACKRVCGDRGVSELLFQRFLWGVILGHRVTISSRVAMELPHRRRSIVFLFFPYSRTWRGRLGNSSRSLGETIAGLGPSDDSCQLVVILLAQKKKEKKKRQNLPRPGKRIDRIMPCEDGRESKNARVPPCRRHAGLASGLLLKVLEMQPPPDMDILELVTGGGDHGISLAGENLQTRIRGRVVWWILFFKHLNSPERTGRDKPCPKACLGKMGLIHPFQRRIWRAPVKAGNVTAAMGGGTR